MAMFSKIKTFLVLIKFEHSIFALPFAYLGLFLGSGGLPSARAFFWVTAAMVFLRTAAMCLNRLIDEPLDALNPRTQDRSRAIRELSRPRLWGVAIASISLFVFSAASLNSLCLALSPAPVFLAWLYPYLKKITWGSHFVLGLVLGIAPYGGWLAARPEWAWPPFLLTLAVTSWVSGFDMLYALQDLDFDRSSKLKSFPESFGPSRTLLTVRFLHGTAVLFLAVLGIALKFDFWYWLGWLSAVGLILWEHWLVFRHGTERIDEAFFNMNAWVSVVIFAGTVVGLAVR